MKLTENFQKVVFNPKLFTDTEIKTRLFVE